LNRPACQAPGNIFFWIISDLGTFLKSITGIDNENQPPDMGIFSVSMFITTKTERYRQTEATREKKICNSQGQPFSLARF
jgi:hypothetical protein